MTLDPRPTDAELLAKHAAKTPALNGVRLGPNSPRLPNDKRARKPKSAKVLKPYHSDDPIDPFASMNGWERRRAHVLEAQLAAKQIRWWRFGQFALRLARATFYHADFVYQRADGQLVIEDVKGHMRDDAAVKLKVTARLYPMAEVFVVRPDPSEPMGWRCSRVVPG